MKKLLLFTLALTVCVTALVGCTSIENIPQNDGADLSKMTLAQDVNFTKWGTPNYPVYNYTSPNGNKLAEFETTPIAKDGLVESELRDSSPNIALKVIGDTIIVPLRSRYDDNAEYIIQAYNANTLQLKKELKFDFESEAFIQGNKIALLQRDKITYYDCNLNQLSVKDLKVTRFSLLTTYINNGGGEQNERVHNVFCGFSDENHLVYDAGQNDVYMLDLTTLEETRVNTNIDKNQFYRFIPRPSVYAAGGGKFILSGKQKEIDEADDYGNFPFCITYLYMNEKGEIADYTLISKLAENRLLFSKANNCFYRFPEQEFSGDYNLCNFKEAYENEIIYMTENDFMRYGKSYIDLKNGKSYMLDEDFAYLCGACHYNDKVIFLIASKEQNPYNDDEHSRKGLFCSQIIYTNSNAFRQK